MVPQMSPPRSPSALAPILGFSLACLLSASLGCGSPEKKEEPRKGEPTNPAPREGENPPAKPPEKPAPKASELPLAGKWTRMSDGTVFVVLDDGKTLRGKLETDPL